VTGAAHDLVLFDLDGTLTDPMEGFVRSMNFALTHFGYEPVGTKDLAAFIGPPIEEAFKGITGKDGALEINALIAKYRERYNEVGYSENVVYGGMPEALEQLSAANVPMAVCTSKRRDFAEKILELFGLRRHFRFVSGGDVGLHKWQQMASLRAEKKVSVSSIMVGDRAVDMIAAHRNGLKAGGVLWGYGSHSELSGETPLHIFQSPGELQRLARGSQNPA
jgi:phosphoglycolate phosphatase